MSTQTDINNMPIPKLTLVVAALVAANVVFFLLTLITNTDPTRAFGLSVAPFAEATNPFSWLWSLRLLVTHSFFHENWGHLIPNMMFLLAFGPILEVKIGSKPFAYLYGTAVLVSGLFSFVHASCSRYRKRGGDSCTDRRVWSNLCCDCSRCF
ncbi:MAG: rhomboid family intramembrane serine protease [Candidatus Obscuribacter sp.]|nr:rhomboid family intramembrane serine protease [Candidatus Obscuribacter sp.]